MLGGYVFALAALGFLIFANTAANIAVFGVSSFLFTFGAAWGLGVFYSILPELFDQEKVPLATGLTGGVGDMGMPLAPFFVGAVFGIRGLWRAGWLLCAFVLVLSIAAIMILLRAGKTKCGHF
jgi:MFS family permease